MSGDFSLTGDPASIRSSAGTWSTFSTQAGSAAADIRRIDSGDFVGDEADTYRQKMNSDLPPHLETTSQAWSIVSSALTAYADKLESLQSKMNQLAADADQQRGTVSGAQNDLANAKTADANHVTSQEAAKKALKPGQTLPADTYQLQTSGASSNLTAAQNALQGTIDKANQLRSEHDAAVTACVNEINRAKGMRFEEPPGFWGRLKDSVCNWIADHADVLKAISGVLKTISAVAGILSFIPVLAPIMGPIALVTGGAALAIDVTVKLATGKGSWTDIAIDAGAMLLPGAGKLLGKGIKGVVGAERVAAAGSKMNSLASTVRNAPGISKAFNGLSKANSAFEKMALKVPGVKLANVRAGRLSNTPKFDSIDDAVAHARPRLQSEADSAWARANTKSDPSYFANPAAQGPKTRWDQFNSKYGRDPNAAVRGTWAHSDLDHALRTRPGDFLPDGSGYQVRPEVSYDATGAEVAKGTKDTVRPDVVFEKDTPSGWQPQAATDLKTGNAGITDGWRSEVSNRTGMDPARITELRPGGGPTVAPGPAASSTGGSSAWWASPVGPMPSAIGGGS